MKKASILTLSLVSLFVGGMGTLAALSNNASTCGNPNCTLELYDRFSGTVSHFDKYGNLIGRTKG